MHGITCGSIELIQNAAANTTYVQSNGSCNQLIVKGSDYSLGYSHSPFTPTLVTYLRLMCVGGGGSDYMLGYNFSPFIWPGKYTESSGM